MTTIGKVQTGMTSDLVAHFKGHRGVLDAAQTAIGAAVDRAGDALLVALRDGRHVYSFGNGGSATQASHFAGELAGRYKLDRAPLAAISLVSDAGTMTCIANDYGFAAVFERQIEALAGSGDVAVAFTTSGRSENVIRGLRAATARGAVTIALTGSVGLAGTEVDHLIAVPSAETAYVQELHLMVLHVWCLALDREFAGTVAGKG